MIPDGKIGIRLENPQISKSSIVRKLKSSLAQKRHC
jgi:hypothetical protein